jgi:hypothetical protein
MDSHYKMKIHELVALYQSLQPDTRSTKCPRKGIYKVLDVYEGHFYNKFAMMARTVWKYAENDNYNDDFVVDIQLESLKRNCSPERIELLRKSSLVGRELKVHFAMNTDIKFILKWSILDLPSTDVDNLNKLFAAGKISMDSIAEAESLHDTGERDDDLEINYYDGRMNF